MGALRPEDYYLLANSFIASIPNHDIFLKAIYEINKNLKSITEGFFHSNLMDAMNKEVGVKNVLPVINKKSYRMNPELFLNC